MSSEWDWPDLTNELDHWADSGRIATFWWRDDDAVAVTGALRRAVALSRRHAAPIHLAVIPAGLKTDLVDALEPGVFVLQHGYAHAQGELHWNRPHEEVLGELQNGRRILDEQLHQWFLPVLVAPWNRIRTEFFPLVSAAGLRAVSAHGARPARFVAPGVEWLNIHSGPLDWSSGTPRFAGSQAPLRAIVEHLRARRALGADGIEPTGYCTHHLDSDEASWAFSARLIDVIAGHPASRWISLGERFQTGA